MVSQTISLYSDIKMKIKNINFVFYKIYRQLHLLYEITEEECKTKKCAWERERERERDWTLMVADLYYQLQYVWTRLPKYKTQSGLRLEAKQTKSGPRPDSKANPESEPQFQKRTR